MEQSRFEKQREQEKQVLEDVTGEDLRRLDSSDIYGTKYFDYRDSLATFHMGYSIPRDSAYKVHNIKEFASLNYLIRQDTTNPGPYLDRGNHFQNIKMYVEAIRDYDKYIQLNPYNQSAYMNRGNAHERLQHFDQALRDYDKVLELKPDDTIAHFNKGVVYDYLGRFDLAVQEYSLAISKDPRLAKAYYNRGISNEQLGNLERSRDDWQMAIQLNPAYREELMQRIRLLDL
ncbi:MAG: tetratricopeptide repeat protein [Ignavibacteria bacterium]